MDILGRTPPEEGSARTTDLHLTTHNIYKRQISINPAGFEFAIPATKRLKT
jgi:hypothetical protein